MWDVMPVQLLGRARESRDFLLPFPLFRLPVKGVAQIKSGSSLLKRSVLDVYLLPSKIQIRSGSFYFK